MAPRGSASSVFTVFETNGWPTIGLACLVGLNGPVPYLTGADSSVHLSEELKNAGWTLPRSMMTTAISNYITSFVVVVTLMFCLGDIDSIVQSPTGQPYIAVVLNATNSVPATKTLAVVVLILVVSCYVNGVTTTSRQLCPVNAMAVSMGFTVILTCIAIGSQVAYGIFVSLNVSGLVTSYIICIACMLRKRIRGETLPASQFNLGKAGNAINIIALCFLMVFWIFQFFPAAPNPAPADMNWSCVIWTTVLVFFMTYYAVWGRHTYTGPVRYSDRAVAYLQVQSKILSDNGSSKNERDSLIQIDSLYAERIRARQDIIHQYPGALDCLDSAVGMLNELYEFLVRDYLPYRYPTIFRLDSAAGAVENRITNEVLSLTPPADRYETLRKINRNVDEDFLMLLPSPDFDGYSLQSFVWAYPVGFDPQSKLRMKLRDAHKPVPGYTEKLAPSMDRYFSKLQPGNFMSRVNWALATNNNLCERGEYHLYPGNEPTETDFDLASCYVRCELQTLFALPKSGGRILSVHLYLYPLHEIKDVGLGPKMAAAIDGLKNGNVPGFHRYKR
ncbi:MAG: hypothetical protein Q9191_006720 [Dirinaria sp. TL-2023a]